MAIISNSRIDTSVLAQQFARWASSPAARTAQPQADAALTPGADRWSDARQAIDKLSQATQEIKQSKKAFAAEMIRRIKEQLKMLMMMGGGDPKARAQQIARLARELAAAAQEYASASGGNSADNTTQTASAQPGDSAAANGNAGNAEAAEPAGADASTANAATSAAAQAGAAPQLSEQLRSQLSAYSNQSTSPDAQADREFAMEVRKLAAQLKALAKQSEVRSSKDPHRSTDREMAAIDDALKEVEHSLARIDPSQSTATASVDVVAK